MHATIAGIGNLNIVIVKLSHGLPKHYILALSILIMKL